jgi:hypothetical protein
MSASNRWLLLVGAGALALVIVSLVVALAIDREAELDPASPEGTVQLYLRAIADRDAQGAYEFYSGELQDRCDIGYLRDSLRHRSSDFRATLVEVTPRGDVTEVVLAVTEIYGSGPLGRSDYTFNQVFVLEEAADGWRFVEPPWPSWCPFPAVPYSEPGRR